jgi:D-3-phosphoglycerate dehydrogenase
MMVDLARGISATSAAYHRGEVPEINMGTQLRGATLGVVGYGAIGSRLAALGAYLDMDALVHTLVKRVDLRSLLKAADFVICLAVATESTENLFDAKAFSLMKASALFINASRGNLVDEQALHAVLSARAIAGSAMDVGRAADQMPSRTLASLPNVTATPHIGGLTGQAVEHQAMETVGQVRSLCKAKCRTALRMPSTHRESRYFSAATATEAKHSCTATWCPPMRERAPSIGRADASRRLALLLLMLFDDATDQGDSCRFCPVVIDLACAGIQMATTAEFQHQLSDVCVIVTVED